MSRRRHLRLRPGRGPAHDHRGRVTARRCSTSARGPGQHGTSRHGRAAKWSCPSSAEVPMVTGVFERTRKRRLRRGFEGGSAGHQALQACAGVPRRRSVGGDHGRRLGVDPYRPASFSRSYQRRLRLAISCRARSAQPGSPAGRPARRRPRRPAGQGGVAAGDRPMAVPAGRRRRHHRPPAPARRWASARVEGGDLLSP